MDRDCIMSLLASDSLDTCTMDDLSQASLSQALKARPFRFYESVASTNDLAHEWLRAGAPRGALVIADEQTQGRGRMGRLWHTPPKVALALSLILHPSAEFVSRVTMAAALAVAQTCEVYGALAVGIKWANDVQIDGKKVCGILPEAAWQDGTLVGVVLGMGVNVRVNFDAELAQTATSLETAVGKRLARAELVARLCDKVEENLARPAWTFAQWRARLTTLGKPVQVGDVQGVAESVDESGALLVRTASGSMERVLAGDVQMGI